jgi:hypothetical protein
MPYSAFLLIVFAIGTAGVILANHTAIIRQLDAWMLLPRPERLTELYFTDIQQLPKKAQAGASQKVSFTLHNIEHEPTTYRYAIVANPSKGGDTQRLKEGTITLDHNQSKIISKTIKIPAMGSRMSIAVQLRYKSSAETSNTKKQSITYWMKIMEPGS